MRTTAQVNEYYVNNYLELLGWLRLCWVGGARQSLLQEMPWICANQKICANHGIKSSAIRIMVASTHHKRYEAGIKLCEPQLR